MKEILLVRPELESLLETFELSPDWSARCRASAAKLFQRSNQALRRPRLVAVFVGLSDWGLQSGEKDHPCFRNSCFHSRALGFTSPIDTCFHDRSESILVR